MKSLLLAHALLALPAAAAPVSLGTLQNPNNFNRTAFGPDYIDYANPQQSAPEAFHPATQTYEVRLPTGYDPAKTYGLICFIDWVNPGGTPPAAWQPILDKYDLIWMAATNVGNSAWTATRRGATIMGAFRMTELYPINPARIYAVGTSGGAQVASDMLLMRKDFFKGFIGLAGVSFNGDWFTTNGTIPNWNPPGRMDDTNTDNDVGTDYGWSEISSVVGGLNPTYSLLPGHPHAIITNYTDFRRTEIVGIYRYFFMNHGNPAKLIVRPGGHATYEGSSFEEAVRFMTAPNQVILRDRFENANLGVNNDPANTLEAGAGFINRSMSGATAAEADYVYNSKTQKVLRLTPGSGSNAAIVEAKNRFNWTNPDGITIDAKLRAETAAGNNQQIGLHVARGDSDDTPENNPGFHVFLNYGAKNRAVLVLSNGTQIELAKWDHAGTTHPMNAAATDKMFWNASLAPEYVGKTKDFRGEDIRVLLDKNGFQLTFIRPAANLETNFPGKVILACKEAILTGGPNVGTLDGEEHPVVLQGKWSDMNLSTEIEALSFRHWKLLLSNRSLDGLNAAGNALVDEVTLRANSEETNFIPPTITTPGALAVNASSGQGAIVNFSVTATAESGTPLAVTCVPPSGSGFPIGTTPVTCTATDSNGNTSAATFNITVQANGFTPIPPDAPVAATPSTGFGFVTLSWNAVPYATSYTIRRATSAGGPYAIIASSVTAITFSDRGRVNGIPLFYQITASNPAGESLPSATVTATPVPGTAAKANNMLNLDLLGSWTTASVPGPADIALWDATVTDANTTTIGGGASFSGIRITNPIGNVTIQPGTAGNLTLGSQGIDMSTTSSTLTISADTVLSAAQTWHTGASTITASGVLSGTANLAKSGSGILSLSGNNSAYSGEITIKDGTLRYGGSVVNIPVFGTGRITLGESNGSASATLDFGITSSTTVANPLTVSSGSGGRFIRSNMANTAGHTLSGAITGSNDLTFAAGVITYSGASATTYTGNLFITGGRLRLANGSSFNTATILSIASGATVDLNASGSSWNFAGLNDISGAGGTLANAGGTRTINLRGAGNYAFSGNVQSNIKLVVNLSGSGTQTLSGAACNYTGGTTVTAGTLIVNGALTNAAAATVATTGKLAGNGNIAAATTVNGTLAPGDGPGTLTLTGSLAMSATSKLQWQLPGNASTGGDFLNAAAVTVTSGAKLDLLFNAPGSTVSFADPFWQSNRSWPVLSSTGLTGTFALGTVSTDSAARAATGYGVFSLSHAGNAVTLNWTAYSARERWNLLHFNTLSSSDSSDTNKDGENNLIEFATGQNPHSATRSLTSVFKGPTAIAFQYTRSKDALDAGYRFEVQHGDTPAGVSWIDIGPGSVLIDGPIQTVEATFPNAGATRRFVRLRVMTP